MPTAPPTSEGGTPLWARAVGYRFDTSNKGQTGFVTALNNGDAFALAVIAFFDNPNKGRFAAIQRHAIGPAAASVIASRIALGEQCTLLDKIRGVVYGAVAAEPSDVPLTDDVAAVLAARLRAGEGDVAVLEQELAWLGAHRPELAVSAASDLLTATPLAAPFSLTVLGCRAVAAFGAAADIETVFATADDVGAAGDPDTAGQLTALACNAGVDAARLTTNLLRFAANGWPMPVPLVSCVDELDARTVLEVAAQLPAAWSGPHLLAPLTKRAGVDVIRSLVSLPSDQVSWVIANGAFRDAELAELVRECRQVSETALAEAYSRVAAATSASIGRETALNALPRLGIRLLCDGVLAGELDVAAPELAVLATASASTRISVYRKVAWRSPDRASNLAQLLARGDLSDIVELADGIGELSLVAQDALLRQVAPALVEPVATRLVSALAESSNALSALASAPTPAAAVLNRWIAEDDIVAFRALESGEHASARLEHACELLLAGGGGEGRTPDVESELLGALAAANQHVDVCLQIASPEAARPADFVRRALDALVTTPDAVRAAAADVLEVCAALCRVHLSTDVRRAAYRVLELCPPSKDLVELLVERATVEPVLQEDVRAVANRSVERLERLLANGTAQDELEALNLLVALNPGAAVVHARQFVDDAHRPSHRRAGVVVLGDHGDPDVDQEILRNALGDPDAEVQASAQRALRRLTVGDIQRAHERLGELAEFGPEWAALDPVLLYGDHGEPVREALERVAANETKQLAGQAIDQLSEVAKYLVFRFISVCGPGAMLDAKLTQACATNSIDYGAVLKNGNLTARFGWITHIAALYDNRTEHPTKRSSLKVVPAKTDDDLVHAYRLFRDGVGPLLRQLESHVQTTLST